MSDNSSSEIDEMAEFDRLGRLMAEYGLDPSDVEAVFDAYGNKVEEDKAKGRHGDTPLEAVEAVATRRQKEQALAALNARERPPSPAELFKVAYLQPRKMDSADKIDEESLPIALFKFYYKHLAKK